MKPEKNLQFLLHNYHEINCLLLHSCTMSDNGGHFASCIQRQTPASTGCYRTF